MSILRSVAAVLIVTCVVVPGPGRSQVAASTPASQSVEPFRFFVDDFWLNLHSFLYVLGRSEMQAPDRTRRAVVNAPIDAANGLATASDAERAAWQGAVTFYAGGPSRRDAVFDDGMVAITRSLADAGNAAVAPAIDADGFSAEWRAALDRAAPVYRRLFWPAHRAANERRRASQNALVSRYGASVLNVITRAYGMRWMPGGYPVHLSGYANWAGAYSTSLGTLVVSSLDDGNAGVSGFETLFHEAMHQWDQQMDDVFKRVSASANVKVPAGFSHALIFYTAGEATRQAVPDHVPYAIANGLWPRIGANIKDALDAAWRPYLVDGTGSRDAALADAFRIIAAKRPHPRT